ncbi:MAG: FkbM family methyltransferase [Actinobacteria bacterium]|nr:FkbM family methyltransferase [Actinomycetota bacterium]
MEAVTLDGFLAEHPELAPDVLKLDTQGSELAILQGAEETLASVGLVEVEVEFSPIYDRQPLFGDVAAFMTDQGFELLYLNRTLVSRRQVYQGPSRGQLLFGDALFGKREDSLETLTAEQRAKYVILLCQYGHLDLAWQLLQQFPDLNGVIPGVAAVFRSHARPAVRAALMQLDKLLAIALHLRGYNQRGTDSDRSWPVR